MISKPQALLIAAALCCGGILLAVTAVATVPLGLGGPGFGYKKLLLLLVGLEAAGCGALLWRRLKQERKVEDGKRKDLRDVGPVQ